MKKLSFMALAAAGLLLGACADKSDVTESTPSNKYNMIEGKSSWIAIGLAMPADPAATRANEDLVDGEPAEYQVKSGRLVLFKGTSEDISEDNATLITSYDITRNLAAAFQLEDDDYVPQGNREGQSTIPNGEITSTTTRVLMEISDPELGDDDILYAYVILNDRGNLDGIIPGKGTTFDNFKQQVFSAIGIEDEEAGYGSIGEYGLVMTNVPIASQPGGPDKPVAATKVTTLAEVDENAIYQSYDDALAGTEVACIYVERAAVKIEVEYESGNFDVGNTTYTINFSGWGLGNVNYSETGYYNTRQFNTAWLGYYNNGATSFTKYRMVGRTNFLPSNHTTAYRTYFGEDVNYSDNYPGLKNSKLENYDFENEDVVYTYENTFDADHQTFANATYVGFQATIARQNQNPVTFYTLKGRPNTPLYTNDQIKTALKEQYGDVILFITEQVNNGGYDDYSYYNIEPDLDIDNIERDENTGKLNYNLDFSVTVYDVDGNVIEHEEIENAVASAYTAYQNSHGDFEQPTIYKYEDGIAYYAARIKHFGDAETPWTIGDSQSHGYDDVYPAEDRYFNWLGRWGIVRNNWYKLEVNDVKGFGSPVPIDFSEITDPIDGTDESTTPWYIGAHIHVLPWVKRFQETTLR